MDIQLRLRKFSPIDREYPIYEIVQGQVSLFDVGRNDAGDYEIAFHPASSGKILSLDAVKALIREAEQLLSEE